MIPLQLSCLILCSICSFLFGQINQQLEAWADEFGGDFELTIAGSTVVFVTGAEDMRRILLLRPTVYKRGWTPVSRRVFSAALALHAER